MVRRSAGQEYRSWQQRSDPGAAHPSAPRLPGGPPTPQTLPRVTPVEVLDRLRLVARTLEAEPGLTSRELGERVGCRPSPHEPLLLRLEEHGHVAHEGRRWFPGPATGRLGPPPGRARIPRACKRSCKKQESALIA